jgi:hypothetical protein
MSNIIKEITIDALDKYCCVICDYTTSNCSNLNAHNKSKKHKDKINKNDNCDILYKKLTKIQEDSFNLTAKINNEITLNEYVELENELNNHVVNGINFICKTIDDNYYICTCCSQYFKSKRYYDQHITKCQQIQSKFQSFKTLAIKMAIQIKQMESYFAQCQKDNRIAEKVYPELVHRYNAVEEQLKKKSNHITELKMKKKELKFKYEQLMNEHNELKLNHQKLETEKSLNEKVKLVLKEHQLYSNSFNNNSTNNFNGPVNIILGDAPAFKYINPFINPLTEMPHHYDFAPERLILRDNFDATNEIKSSLCNAYAFHQRFIENKLVDHVAKCIIHTYKNSEYDKQSFWSTDTSRGSYMVRIEGSDKDYWQKDKDGEYLKNNLMVPLINYIRTSVELLRLYNIQKYICNYDKFDYNKPIPPEITAAYSNFVNGFNEELTGEEIRHFSKLFMELDELKLFTSDDKFRKNVLIKIASKFYLDKHKCLLEYQKKKNIEDKKSDGKVDLIEV